jgi:hypothetical protein
LDLNAQVLEKNLFLTPIASNPNLMEMYVCHNSFFDLFSTGLDGISKKRQLSEEYLALCSMAEAIPSLLQSGWFSCEEIAMKTKEEVCAMGNGDIICDDTNDPQTIQPYSCISGTIATEIGGLTHLQQLYVLLKNSSH